jgi:hypothetical protein
LWTQTRQTRHISNYCKLLLDFFKRMQSNEDTTKRKYCDAPAMSKLKIYLDTNVISCLDAPETPERMIFIRRDFGTA